jgi:hypothetical protein
MELCVTAERRWKHLKKKGRREPRRLPRAFVEAVVPEMQVRRNGRSFYLRVSFDPADTYLRGTTICVTGLWRSCFDRDNSSLHRRRLCSEFD